MSSRDTAALLEESSWLASLARRLVQDPGLADDLAQETMVAALQAANRPDGRGTRGWLATILRRKLASSRRADARRGYRERIVAPSEALPSAHEVGVLLESERLLRDALSELPDPYRRALTLRYREGLSAAEIGRRDGEPAATVRSRIRTGLQQLRKLLEARDQHWATTLIPMASLRAGQVATASKGVASSLGLVGGLLAAGALLLYLGIPLLRMLQDPAPAAGAGVTLEPADGPGGGGVDALRRSFAPSPRVALAVPESADPTSAAESQSKKDLAPGVIEITVEDAEGRPIPGAWAQRFDDDHSESYSDHSGPDGRLEVALLTQGYGTQKEEVLFRAPGWAAERLELTFRSGERDPHPPVILSPAGILRGAVHDPEGLEQGFVLVFVSPLPETLTARLQNGARPRDLGPEFRSLEFHGSFGATAPGSGAFELTDVAVGTVGQVIAMNDSRGGRLGLSEVVTVPADSILDLDPIVVLTPKDDTVESLPDTGVRVRMVLPEGADPEEFEVVAYVEAKNSYTAIEPKRATRTEYRIPLAEAQSVTVELRHKECRFMPRRRSGVRLGEGDVVLEVQDLEPVRLEVASVEGVPVPEFAMELKAERSTDTRASEPLRTVLGQDGLGSFRPPVVPWRLEITDGSGGALSLGPFRAGQYDGPQSVELVRARAYRGVLHRSGVPLAGATLHLRERCAPGLAYRTGELLSRAKPASVIASVRTGPDGAFEFPPLGDESVVLGVQVGALAVGAFELGQDEVLDLDVPGTGILVGTVEALHGELAGGTVTASTELGLRRSVPFGPDGAFRFDDLPAGDWFLGETYWSYQRSWVGEAEDQADVEPGSGPSYFWTSHAREVERRPGTEVTVTSEEVTSVKVFVQTDAPVALSGTVLMDGKRPANRELRIRPRGKDFFSAVKDQRFPKVDRRGAFQVNLPEAGQWLLTSPLDDLGSALLAEFEVRPGEAPEPLEVNFQTGTLVLVGLTDDEPVSISVEGPVTPALRLGAFILPKSGAGRRLVLDKTLAGTVYVHSRKPSDGAQRGPLATGVLEPGGRLELQIR